MLQGDGKKFPKNAIAVYLEGSKTPHFGLIFNDISGYVQKDFKISGVSSFIACFLGNHKHVQNWDFVEYKKDVILLIPKRYLIFGGLITSFIIHLSVKKN